MTEFETSRLIVNNQGQVTLSELARKHLGIEDGATLIEVLVGNFLVLLPQTTPLHILRTEAADALRRSGVTHEEIVAEADRLRNDRFNERYPGID